jgi:hypothetical protein
MFSLQEATMGTGLSCARIMGQISKARPGKRPCTAGVAAALALIIGTSVISPARAVDTNYRDPRQPSYSLLVPDGWTIARTEQGVQLSRGTAHGYLLASRGAVPAGALLAQLRQQFESQSKIFREIASGELPFGGQRGAYGVYSAVSPTGLPVVLRVMTTTNGRMAYSLFFEVNAGDYERTRIDIERIQSSFMPDPVK